MIRFKKIFYDPWILASALALFGLGLLMVTSASIVISDRTYHYPFYHLSRQLTHLILGFSLGAIIIRIPIAFWEKMGGYLILICFSLLLLVLIPGVGHEVNGGMRWIIQGPFSLQVSEVVKLGIIIYLAGYLVRRQEEVQTRIRGFIKPLLLMSGIAMLLLQEPDFGATVVVIATALGMMFLAGVRLWQFIFLLVAVITSFGIMAISVPYRVLRLTTFLHPWSNPFDSGYQLTQALIAFGRGGIFGVGLGNSVQKLFYLPEAHTDFLFAVLGEELGLIGQLVVLGLFTILIGRALVLSYQTYHRGNLFNAYLGYGLSISLSLQVMISIGVNLGILPTKGLTLPLMSYGGTSLLVNCITVALLLRLAFEARYRNIRVPMHHEKHSDTMVTHEHNSA